MTATRHPLQDQDPEQPVAVTSDAPRLSSLGELVTAADVVVLAEVVATERGRPFGLPGGGSVESRLVTLEVDEVMAGATGDDPELAARIAALRSAPP